MKTFKTLSLVLIGLVLITACDQQQASEQALDIMEKDTMMEKEENGMAMEKMEKENDAMMEKENDAMMEADADAMMEKDGDAMMEADADAMMEKDGDAMMEADGDDMMEKDDNAMMEADGNAMMEKDDDAMEQSAFMIEPYTAARFAALKGNTPVVINFHADWCPVCKALDGKLEESMADLPKGTVMLKADFDDEVELKREFGITQQTTLVFFDASGEKIAQEYNPSIQEIADLLAS